MQTIERSYTIKRIFGNNVIFMDFESLLWYNMKYHVMTL